MIVEGSIFPLARANVDTDQIIPTRFLGSLDLRGLGRECFSGLPGIDRLYAVHPDATIVAAGENFGAGSSREHAVWALQGRGFRAAIAPSFARIFEENAYNNGFVVCAVPPDAIDAVLAARSARIDVAAESILLDDGRTVEFKLDPLRKEFVLGGGFLAYMEAQIPEIRAWEAAKS
ncbi:MAG: 3-isopropylmalate dehydratase small subunit [Candidatus Eremiobacteraeota bacterium]|nr:3-isopropylmalate dehydratase small subunit [Candidatus Eremiobacteraeota bacterium]